LSLRSFSLLNGRSLLE